MFIYINHSWSVLIYVQTRLILGLLPEFKYCVAESQKGAKRFYLFVTKQHSIGNWNNAEVTGDCNLQFGRKSGPMCILFLVSYIIDSFAFWLLHRPLSNFQYYDVHIPMWPQWIIYFNLIYPCDFRFYRVHTYAYN